MKSRSAAPPGRRITSSPSCLAAATSRSHSGPEPWAEAVPETASTASRAAAARRAVMAIPPSQGPGQGALWIIPSAEGHAMAKSKPVVTHIAQAPVHARGDGVETLPLVGAENSAGGARVTRGVTRLPPGTKNPFHSHNCDEQV